MSSHLSDPDALRKLYEHGQTSVLIHKDFADMFTPVSVYCALSGDNRISLLFESVEKAERRGRYSAVIIEPDIGLETRGHEVFDLVFHHGKLISRMRREGVMPLDALREFVAKGRFDLPDFLPSIAAGTFGYLGYDMVHHMEDICDANARKLATLDVPDSRLIRPSLVMVFDHVTDTVFTVQPLVPSDGLTFDHCYERALKQRSRIVETLCQARSALQLSQMIDPPQSEHVPQTNMSEDAYKAAVAIAKDHIYEGDIFQVVLSLRFSLPFTQPPLSFYRALRHINPAPFLFLLDFGDFSVCGASPEILVRVEERDITIRPIAGTRPRGKTFEEDQRLAEELLADAKERAEHLMLLDLGRNDVGRFAEIGSVRVDAQYQIERYSAVMHIISETRGTLGAQYDAIDALIGGFPAGTVSGAPKVRAMQIIHDLEPDARQIYAGAVGYFSANGDMDTCIALRTAVLKDGKIHVQAGAGIVADSDPQSEYQECCNKAAALLKAAQLARVFD